MRSQNPRSLLEAVSPMLTAEFGGQKSTLRGGGASAPRPLTSYSLSLICGKQRTLWDCYLVLDDCVVTPSVAGNSFVNVNLSHSAS